MKHFSAKAIGWGIVAVVAGAPVLKGQDFDLKEAVVYEAGARLKRADQVTLDGEGVWSGTLYSLSSAIQPATIQVHLPEGWSMAGNAFKMAPDARVQAANGPKVKAIEADNKALQETRDMRMALRETYAEELTMLLSNRTIGGDETLLVEDLREAANFWRDRVRELKYLMLELDLEVKEIDSEMRSLMLSRDSLNNLMNRTYGAIDLRLQGPAGAKGRVEVDYVTSWASWRPVYEASVDATGGIKMRRFAEVSQNTGNDWEGLTMAFSAGNPMLSLSPPEVQSLELRPVARRSGFVGSSYEMSGVPMTAQEDVATARMFDALEVVKAPRQDAGMERYVFEPVSRLAVSGTGKPERVELGDFELDGELRMLSLPGFSDEAYQLASTDAWAGQRLMGGEVQVIAGGAYRGAFPLQLPAPGDTLEFPLGQDPQVRSSRIRRADRCKSSVFGAKKESNVVWEITLMNQHDRAVDLRVMDRVAVSRHEEIEVKVEDLSGGELNPNTGVVSWNVKLGAGEQRKLILAYKVTYPKSFYLPNL
jgi:uncharacterized protein (TIGR02231 family)